MEPKFINHGKERRFQSYNIAVCSCGKRNQECYYRQSLSCGKVCQQGGAISILLGWELRVCQQLNRQMASADLNDNDWECFLNVGFSNHREIIRKTSTLEERLFYIRRCSKEFWNVETTKFHLKEDLYHKEGSIQQTNFDKTLEEPDFKQRALESFKEEYHLDFINNDDMNERVIEQKVVQNIKKFIMAFGPEFSFMGNQYRLEVSGQEFFIDLSFSDTSKPMGVSTYRTSQELPEHFRKALPNIEDLKRLL